MFQWAYSQMEINSANYFVNPFVLNPAYTGKFRNQSIMLDVRKDVAGIDGSPSSQYLTYDWGMVPDKIGVGIMIKNDVEGLMRHHMGYLNFSYRVKITDDQFFDLGLNAGLVYRGINFNNVRAKHPDESTINAENSYSSSFDGGFGLRYVYKGLEAGIALNHLFEPDFSFTNTLDQTNLSSTLSRQYLMTLGYNWDLENDFEVKPLVVLSSSHGTPFRFEVGSAAWWKKMLWLSAMYKHDIGVNVSAGLEIQDRFSFAYSYHYYTGSLNRVTNGAHEVIVGLRLGKAKNKEEENKFKELEKQNAELFEQLEILKQQNEANKEQIDDLKQGYSEVEKDSMKSIIDGLQEVHEHLDEHAVFIENEKDNHGVHPDSVHHESEESTGKYRVIIGSFNEMGHAKSMQQIIQREYGQSSELMKNEKSGRFLIYSKECDHQEDCKVELNRIKVLNSKGIIKGEPWLLKSE